MARGVIMIVRRRLRKRADAESEDSVDRCMICLDALVEATVRGLLPCGHRAFCFACVLAWSKASNKCPLCAARFHSLKQVVGAVVLQEDAVQDCELLGESGVSFLDFVQCLVCGSDQDEHILLLCDYCDAGYHTSCLGMDCIPDLAVWFCDRCLSLFDPAVVEKQWEQMERAGRCRDAEATWTRRKRLRKLNPSA